MDQIDRLFDDVESAVTRHLAWPAATVEPPDDIEMMELLEDGVMAATDGCTVEPDGICEHGHPSWLLAEGMI
jgi:hypothetical protein